MLDTAIGLLFYSTLGITAVGFIGLLWAVPGATLCAAVARLRRLDARSYWVEGARWSASGFLPWIYLFLKLVTGISAPMAAAFPVYACIYVVLFSYVVLGVLSLVAIPTSIIFGFDEWNSPSTAAPGVAFVLLALTIPFISVVTVISLRNLWLRFGAANVLPKELAVSPSVADYLMPFAWLVICSATLCFVILAVSVASFTGG